MSKNKAGQKISGKVSAQTKSQPQYLGKGKDPDILWAMSHAPAIDKDTHGFQVLVATFFTAIIMMLVYMKTYESNMEQFFWSGGGTDHVDFFSILKSQAILFTAAFALLILLYHLTYQMLYIKRSYAYIPMLVFSVFVALSYLFSDYKEYALFGWNDRFEGTLVLLSYMVVLFYIINTINTEKNVKWVLYPLAATSSVLGLIGVSQYFMVDFFQTEFAKKMITPSLFWDQLDKLKFNFRGGQVYQTVFNPNYVSFYLTLLVPVFAMIFIHESNLIKKIIWGFVFAILMFNLIGSASSGGILGLGIAFIVALIVLNKRLIEWKKSVAVIVLITIVIAGFTFSRFMPELTSAIGGVLKGPSIETPQEPGAESKTPLIIDYFETGTDQINVSINGEVLTIKPIISGSSAAINLTDANGKNIAFKNADGLDYGIVDDPRFDMCRLGFDNNDGTNYIILQTGDEKWPFAVTKKGVQYRNAVGKLLSLEKVSSFGFKSNPTFGTYRGYIWSRSLPLIRDTLIVGHGADTYCLYFPHNDYAGKFSVGWDKNIIVDKPHNLYLGAAINTGVISLLALLTLFGLYLKESFKLYRRLAYDSFAAFAGAGIFIGISGFLAAAFVNDSSVSTMPLFYGLLGVGIATNKMIKRKASRI